MMGYMGPSGARGVFGGRTTRGLSPFGGTGGAGGGGIASAAQMARPGGPGGTSKTVTEVAPQAPSPEVLALFEEAMKRYQPGGQFGKRELALLGRAKKKTLARGYQSAVSAGLGGTSVPEAMGAKFQEEIGEPTRLGLEDVRTQRLNELMMAKAGYLGGIGPGGKTTTTATTAGGGGGYGGGYGGGVFGRVDPVGTYAGLQRTSPGWGAMAPGNDPLRGGTTYRGAGANLPEGGRIIGNIYYPPQSRFTRNVPTLNL